MSAAAVAAVVALVVSALALLGCLLLLRRWRDGAGRPRRVAVKGRCVGRSRPPHRRTVDVEWPGADGTSHRRTFRAGGAWVEEGDPVTVYVDRGPHGGPGAGPGGEEAGARLQPGSGRGPALALTLAGVALLAGVYGVRVLVLLA